MIQKTITHNGIEVYESIVSDAPKPVETFIRLSRGVWYLADERTGRMMLVEVEESICSLEQGRSMAILDNPLNVQRRSFERRRIQKALRQYYIPDECHLTCKNVTENCSRTFCREASHYEKREGIVKKEIEKILEGIQRTDKDYGKGGISGPTVPNNMGATVHDYLEQHFWSKERDRHIEAGKKFTTPQPEDTIRIVTAAPTEEGEISRRVLAIVPLNMAAGSKPIEGATEEQEFLVTLFANAPALYKAASAAYEDAEGMDDLGKILEKIRGEAHV